jgi:hypothetical protein
MPAAQHFTAQVLSGGRVEIASPDLLEGQIVEVTVVPRPKTPASGPNILEFFDSLPPGPRGAKTWEELERHFQEERNS